MSRQVPSSAHQHPTRLMVIVMTMMMIMTMVVMVRTMVVMVMLVKIVVVVLAIVVGRKKRDRMAGLEFGPCVPCVGRWTMVR